MDGNMHLPDQARQADSPRVRPLDFRVYTQRNLDQIPQLQRLSEEQRNAMRVVASVLPFRVNNYVVDHLIDWDEAPDDPFFRLVFPQQEMLDPAHFSRISDLLMRNADDAEIRFAAKEIRSELNPHPAGQMTLNVPVMGNEVLHGAQHKYRETLLFFPSE